MADPITIAMILGGAVVFGGGTGLTFVMRGRQRKWFRRVLKVALDV